MAGPRLLIVEDEFLIRLTLSEALQDEGFEVLEAASADEALTMLCGGDPIDLLMTDIQLPGSMDGRELARKAREIAPDLPVIFMTGRPDMITLSGGPAPELFIAKPYLPSEVCAAARRLTGG